MKSRYFEPNQNLYQIVVQDFKHRTPSPLKNAYVDRNGNGIKEVVDHIPLLTLFRRAKKPEQAIASASKKGSVLSCRKVDSHLRYLEKIDYLRLPQKPIEVDVKLEDFTLGRDLEISPPKNKEITL